MKIILTLRKWYFNVIFYTTYCPFKISFFNFFLQHCHFFSLWFVMLSWSSYSFKNYNIIWNWWKVEYPLGSCFICISVCLSVVMSLLLCTWCVFLYSRQYKQNTNE